MKTKSEDVRKTLENFFELQSMICLAINDISSYWVLDFDIRFKWTYSNLIVYAKCQLNSITQEIMIPFDIIEQGCEKISEYIQNHYKLLETEIQEMNRLKQKHEKT